MYAFLLLLSNYIWVFGARETCDEIAFCYELILLLFSRWYVLFCIYTQVDALINYRVNVTKPKIDFFVFAFVVVLCFSLSISVCFRIYVRNMRVTRNVLGQQKRLVIRHDNVCKMIPP